jgi:hypothetical protein
MAVVHKLLRQNNGVNFAAVNAIAIGYLPALVRTWCPQGRMRGHEWQALNPTRPDKNPGSFSINVRTGKWADFATGDRGGDPVSLAAYIFNTTQVEAARTLAAVLGVRL